MNTAFVDLRKPKDCSCGRRHTFATVDVIATPVGTQFNCYCGSTLLDRVENWREIVMKEVKRAG